MKESSRSGLSSLWIAAILALGGVTLADESDGDAAAEMSWHAAGTGGAVAAESPLAVRAAIEILEKGGNANDAAVAALLVASVADYGMFCIGAEVPYMVYDAQTKQAKVLCGLGGAPLDEKGVAWYYEHEIPGGGGSKAVPVPGAVSLFFRALADYGSMDFRSVAQPVLAILDGGGKDWYGALAATLRKLIATERGTVGTRARKLQAARDRFYKGDIADQLAAYYEREGSFLHKRDLEAHTTRVEDPVKVDYRGYQVLKCGPWTQGPVLCQTLQILEGYDLKMMGHLSADYIHVLAESLKLALADRDHYYGDPAFAAVPLEALLSERYGALRRTLIDPKKASTEVRPGDPVRMNALSAEPGKYRPGPGGTSTCVVADRWGNFVAATPSGNQPYNVCGTLGVAHGNRLRSLNTTPGHPNRIEPGKRPRITLTPTLVMKDGLPVMAISVHGGDLQDQTTLNCLLNVIEFGMKPKEAVSAPRFHTNHHEGSFDPRRERVLQGAGSLTLQDRIPKAVQDELGSRGHIVSTTGGAIASPVIIFYDRAARIFYAAGDHQARRHAAVVEPSAGG